MTTIILNTKISEADNKFPNHTTFIRKITSNKNKIFRSPKEAK